MTEAVETWFKGMDGRDKATQFMKEWYQCDIDKALDHLEDMEAMFIANPRFPNLDWKIKQLKEAILLLDSSIKVVQANGAEFLLRPDKEIFSE